jgi:hypothetical protein
VCISALWKCIDDEKLKFMGSMVSNRVVFEVHFVRVGWTSKKSEADG